MRLVNMRVGDKGEVRKITAEGEIRRRLLDMGIVSGARFKVLRLAPLGDPIEIYVKGFHLTLRKEEAGEILVRRTGHRGDHHPMGDHRHRHIPPKTTQDMPTPDPSPAKRRMVAESREPMSRAGHWHHHHHRRMFASAGQTRPTPLSRPAPQTDPAGNSAAQSRAGSPTDRKTIRIALLGNPNSGKTSLFNELAGAHQRVGNFTGVTVERSEGQRLFDKYRLEFIDLPGTYSLTAYSPEELVARNYLIEAKPDIVIDVADGTNLERNLYLTTQLMELECEMLVAVNMYDEVEKQGISINEKQLEVLLGSHVIPTSAVKKEGLEALLKHIIDVYEGRISIAKNKLTYSAPIETAVNELTEILSLDLQLADRYAPRWLAIKLLEKDQEVYRIVRERSIWFEIEAILQRVYENRKRHGQDDPEIAITEDRHAFIRGALQETVSQKDQQGRTLTDRIDNILLNRFLGLPVFVLIMWLTFQLTFTLGEYPMHWIETFFGWISHGLNMVLPQNYFRSLLVDGIISGVGGVLVFLPNILILFLCISLLEGTGYMARASFVIDKVMHLIGLHGKSFIPMITGFGCSVPAIMACRTLKNRYDRLTTMMVIPFMSCGAKLPLYILMIGAFFPAGQAGNILFGIYAFGVLVAILTAKILKSTVFNGDSEPFVMELPPYRMPSIKSLLFQMWFKARMYLKKAGTIILMASMLIWAASNFPELKDSDSSRAQLEYSVAGRIGKAVEPMIKPLGFDWRIGISLISGLAAKEIVVSSISTLFALDEEQEQQEGDMALLTRRLRNDPGMNRAKAVSLIIFVLLYVPCLAASAVFHREAGGWRWTGMYILISMTTAYFWSFVVYRIMLLL